MDPFDVSLLARLIEGVLLDLRACDSANAEQTKGSPVNSDGRAMLGGLVPRGVYYANGETDEEE